MTAKLAPLIAHVRESSQSSFYRTHWEGAEHFEDLPFTDAQLFASTPLPKRRYKDEKALVKIVQGSVRPFLSEWTLSDIAQEEYGSTGSRPMVLLSNSHEAVEKSLWYYERNILPLAGETKNVPVAAFTAHRYDVDAVVSDEGIFQPFLEQYEKEYGTFKAEALTLIGARFSPDAMRWRRRFSGARFVLGLPETGAFAEACTQGGKESLAFHALKSAIVELSEGHLVVTKLPLLATPVIRYRTAIIARPVSCACGREAFAV